MKLRPTSSGRRAWLGSLALLIGGPACVLVDNPNYVDDELGDTSSDDEASESGTSESDPSSEVDTTESTTETETGEQCPPGKAGELGCACGDGLPQCDPGLSCTEGVCSDEGACPTAFPDVLVSGLEQVFTPGNETMIGTCMLAAAASGPTMLMELSNCDQLLLDMNLEISPAELLQELDGITDFEVAVSFRLEADNRFLKIAGGSMQLFVVDGAALHSSDTDLSSYPVPLTEVVTECPLEPLDCGEGQRLAIDAGGLWVYDGSHEQVGEGQHLWVDEALDCDTPSFRFALYFTG